MAPSISLAKHGPTFSRLVPGVMTWGVWGHRLSTAQIQELIEHCLGLGLTTFDHADIYGHYTTEAAFGAVLKQQPQLREQIQLISKCGIQLVCDERPDFQLKSYNTSKKHILESVDRSLRNLNTEYLDLLLLHRPSPLMQPDEIAEAVAQLKRKGKVRFFGVSNFTPTQFEVLRSVTPLVTNQIEVSLLQNDNMFNGTVDQLMQYHLRPMAWSPLGGIFSRDDETANRTYDMLEEIGENYGNPGIDVMTIAWLLRHPAGILPVLGTARKERLTAAVQALDIHLTQEEWFALLEAARGKEVA